MSALQEPDLGAVASALADECGLQVSALEPLAVGFPGNHHYRADAPRGRFFVTVDDLMRNERLAPDADATFGALESAFRAAFLLRHSAGLEFVLAAEENRDGSITTRLSDRYALTVFPFVEGTSNPGGEHASPDERREVLTALARLHSTGVARDVARRDTLAIPQRDGLAEALDELHRPWTTGPYAEPTRVLLSRSADGVRELLGRHEALAAIVAKSTSEWVITHGEPHGANTHRAPDGAMFLVDWDTVAVAPRERDLWMALRRGDAADWSAYSATSPSPPVDDGAFSLYRLWWDLAEIAEYVGRFRRPHVDSPPARYAWEDLGQYLPARSR